MDYGSEQDKATRIGKTDHVSLDLSTPSISDSDRELDPATRRSNLQRDIAGRLLLYGRAFVRLRGVPSSSGDTRPIRILALLIGFGLLYLLAALSSPNGGADAVLMWNIKARYVLQVGDVLRAFQDPLINHTEYPPLMPLTIAFGWQLFGYTQLVVIVLHAAIYLAIIGLVAAYRPISFAVIVGTALLYQSVWQNADLLVALFVLSAWITYQHGIRRELVGLFIGMAALTKNEGIMLLVVMLVTVTLAERRIPVRVLLGAALPMIALYLFKTFVATQPNDIMGSSGTLQRLTDLQRYPVLIPLFIQGMYTFGLGAVLLVTLNKLAENTRIHRAMLLFVGISWAGFFLIYAITPLPLQWHMEMSYDRLIAQLFPTFVLAISARIQLHK